MEPGGTYTVLTQATMLVFLQLLDEHMEACHIHGNHHDMDTALKTMILEAVYSTCIFVLHNVSTGYMGSLMKDIMNRLMEQYERIAAVDI